MTIIREIIEVDRDPVEVFEAVADFATSQSWDPGVVSAERVRDGEGDPLGPGATYRLTVTFNGRESDMTYRTTRLERPTTVVLEGEGDKITAVDTIRVTRAGSNARIDYTADLRLKGLAKIVEPFFGGAFRRMGERALEGMRTWLEAGSP